MRLKAATPAKLRASDLTQRMKYATCETAKRENAQLAAAWHTTRTTVQCHICIRGANAYAAFVKAQSMTNGTATTQMHRI